MVLVILALLSFFSGSNGTEYDYDEFTFNVENDADINLSFYYPNGYYAYQILNEQATDVVFSNTPEYTISDTIISLTSGKYYLEVISLSGNDFTQPYYFGFTEKENVINAVGVEVDENNISKENTLFVYPNPSKDFVKVHYKGKNKGVFYNSTGKVVKKTTFHDSITIDISDLENGVYILEVKNKAGESTSKFIKE